MPIEAARTPPVRGSRASPAGVCASIYSNFLPFITPEAVQLYYDFERALYAAL